MESLLVVPPAIASNRSSRSSSTVASVPDLTPSGAQERSSSETTIVTIYSMYEEDADSWPAADPGGLPSKDARVTVSSIPGYRKSYLQANRGSVEDSAYYDGTYDLRPSSNTFSASDQSRQSVLSTESMQPAYMDSQPPSGGIRTSQGEQYWSSRDSQQRSVKSLSSDPTARPPSSHRRPVSQHRSSVSSHQSHAKTPSTAVPSTFPNLPPSSAPLPADNLSLPSSPKTLSLRTSNIQGSPESKGSIAPSEGEDADAFHVRSTYAQLEVCGVKGDGYEEGVERTRARIGASRASALMAQGALGDEHEKTRDLTPKELAVLSNLDRYGFFVTPVHDRLILLPALPLAKPLVQTTATNTSGPPSPPLLPKLPPTVPHPKEVSRAEKWSRMMEPRSRDQGSNIELWGLNPAKEHKLTKRIFKGIPDCWRSAAWEMLICRYSKTGKTEMRKLGEEYRAAFDQPSSYDVQIDLDVPRTISGHIMFKTRYGQGQRSLFHVLHALSLHCDVCGYCQGMGPLAATFLCYFEPERAYASIVRLHDDYAMHSIFAPGFPGLLEAIYVQERVTEQMLPGVYAACKKHMISTTSYATKWYITLFANSVPFQTQLRLWDAFLLEGHDIFVIIAVSLLWVYMDHITSESATFESILSLLSSFFVPEDEDMLLSWIGKAISDENLRSNMRQWRQDWKGLVASGKDGQALL